jgi:hypothetical protein
MKKTILFASAFFAMLLTTSVSAQVTPSTEGAAQQDEKNKPADNMKCCPSIYVETPAAKPGGKSSRRLLAGNLFKGKNRGIDLTFDVLDASGSPVANGNSSVAKDASGNLVIDYSKLKKGGKYRIRVKAGGATEFYNF